MFLQPILDALWHLALHHAAFTSHALFPSFVALFTFHTTCLVYTVIDIGRKRVPLGDICHCAFWQLAAHGVANAVSVWMVGTDTIRALPEAAPDAWVFVRDLAACFVVGDFLIYWEHVLMHRIVWLRQHVHKFHHMYQAPMFSWCAGWVHPVEIMVALACELSYPFAMNVHPLTLWVFIALWVFLLVEEHCGYDMWWSLHHLLPFATGGGNAPHELHHKPFVTKNFGFVFSVWDRLFDTYEPPESKRDKGVK